MGHSIYANHVNFLTRLNSRDRLPRGGSLLRKDNTAPLANCNGGVLVHQAALDQIQEIVIRGTRRWWSVCDVVNDVLG